MGNKEIDVSVHNILSFVIPHELHYAVSTGAICAGVYHSQSHTIASYVLRTWTTCEAGTTITKGTQVYVTTVDGPSTHLGAQGRSSRQVLL